MDARAQLEPLRRGFPYSSGCQGQLALANHHDFSVWDLSIHVEMFLRL